MGGVGFTRLVGCLGGSGLSRVAQGLGLGSGFTVYKKCFDILEGQECGRWSQKKGQNNTRTNTGPFKITTGPALRRFGFPPHRPSASLALRLTAQNLAFFAICVLPSLSGRLLVNCGRDSKTWPPNLQKIRVSCASCVLCVVCVVCKLRHYGHEILELLAQGIHYRPLVWSADGRPQRSLEHCSTQQTTHPAATVNRCWRNRFNTDGTAATFCFHGAMQVR